MLKFVPKLRETNGWRVLAAAGSTREHIEEINDNVLSWVYPICSRSAGDKRTEVPSAV